MTSQSESEFQTIETVLPQVDLQNYGVAVVRIAWLKRKSQNSLLFCVMELVPNEYFEAQIEPAPGKKFDGLEGEVVYQKVILPPSDALVWYEGLRGGSAELDEETISLIQSSDSVMEEPSWPNLVCTNKLPFSNPHFGPVQGHVVLQDRGGLIDEIFARPEIVDYLSNLFFFDFNRYPEYFGACSLLVPNPVIRSISCKMAETPEAEYVDFNLVLRPGKTFEGIKLLVTEIRPLGATGVSIIDVDKPFIRIKYSERIEKIAFSVVSEKYGLLLESPAANFVRSISVETSIAGQVKEVHVPETKKKAAQSYRVQMQNREPQQTIKTRELHTKSASQAIYRADRVRETKSLAENMGKKWFHGNQQEAVEFIRALIGKAKRRVTIIDPYFATVELFQFALATKNPGVKAKILSSKSAIKNADQVVEEGIAADVINDQVKHLESKGVNIEFLVMTGDSPVIHDRFLIIDDEVWLSGNSLNNIGLRAGMMIKIPDANHVINMIENIMDGSRVVSLDEWLSKRK